MLAIRSTGLVSILPQTVRSCLADAPVLPYNWSSKLQGLVLGIALARSLLLQDIARTRWGRVKTIEDALSHWLSRGPRLDLRGPHRAYVIAALRRLGRRRLWRYRGKAVLIVDSTAYPKPRSRGKVRPMPQKGKVRLHNLPTKEKVLAPGYQEIWGGLLLKNRTCLGIMRRLWTERGPNPASLNLVEEAEIAKVRDLVREALGLDVILVADRGFGRKELLGWLKRQEGMDFIIRIEGKLTVRARGWKGLLKDLALGWEKRVRMRWRDKSQRPLVSDVSASRVSIALSGRARLGLNVLCLQPVRGDLDPMFLATTSPIAELQGVMTVVRFYSARWTVETFFDLFKNGLRAASWRVFSCWQAIDRLLTAAHMAYLALVLLSVFCERTWCRRARMLRRRLKEELSRRFARPPELTLGRLFEILAMDFASLYVAGGPYARNAPARLT